MPEQVLLRIKQRIRPGWKIVVVTTFLFGLIAHMYKFTNHLPNWDSLMEYYYPTHNMIHQGRHFQCIPAALRGFVDLSWLVGFLCLIYISLAGILIIEIMEMRQKLCIAIVSALIVVSPTIISCFGYMYMADAFAFAYFMAVLGVFLTLKYKYGWIPGAVCLGLSMGSYQAYLPVAVCLILLWIVGQTLKREKLTKDFWMQVVRFLLFGGSAAVFYKVSLSVMEKLEGIEVVNHQGLGSMRVPSFSQAVQAAVNSYVDGVYYFTGSLSDLSVYGVLNIVAIVCLFLMLVWLVWKRQVYKRVWNILVCIGCLVAYPCGAHLIYFLTDEVEYHSLMQFGMVLLYVLLFWLYEQMAYHTERETKEKTGLLLYWGSIITSVLLTLDLIISANAGYYAQMQSYEQTYSLVGRVVDRMEQLPDYDGAARICMVGSPENSDTIIYGDSPALAGFTDEIFITHQKHMVAMLEEYYGVYLTGASDDEVTELLNSEIYKQMENWPSAGAVAQVGDTIIIKFGNP